MESETVIAVAGAIESTAEFGKKALESADSLGGFLAPYVRGPLGQLSGAIETRLAYWRESNAIKLAVKFREELLVAGIEPPIRPLPIGFAIDAFEQGSLEEDDALQGLWARLLANAADSSTGVEARRAYISILKDFSSLDAVVFEKLYSAGTLPGRDGSMLTGELPNSAVAAGPAPTGGDSEPPHDVKLSILNLERLGLISLPTTWKGGHVFGRVNLTLSGQDLMRAIRRRQA